MMSRITLSLKREAWSDGDDDDDYYLDSGFPFPERSPVTFRTDDGWGQRTACPHTSVIPISNRTSVVSGSHSVPHLRRPTSVIIGRPHKHRNGFLPNSQETTMQGSGVMSIISLRSHISDEDRQRERDANIPVIAEHEKLSDRDAYELRTLRPSARV